MANVSSNMLITDESLSQISQELLDREDIYFEFPYLMIGDGTYPLVNNSSPILNHSYQFPIEEINRTNNNILLTATIDEEAYLTIKEIALYCTYGDGTTHIFSKIEGLNVRKDRNLAYNLMIQVKLDINVVNTIAMPEIVLNDVKYPKMSEFLTVKEVYAYTVENLERMIKTNALGIGTYSDGLMTERKPVGVGYNLAQTYCMLQDKLNSWEDNFYATFNYTSIKNRYQEITHTDTYFDKGSLITFGGAAISEDGEGIISGSSSIKVENEALIGNSTTYYVDAQNETFVSPNKDFYVDVIVETMINTQIDRIEVGNFEPINFNRWDFTTSFTTGESVTGEATVLNFQNFSQYQPLVLGTRAGKCFLELGGAVTVQAEIDGNSVLFNNGTSDMSPFIEWVTKSPALTNLHVIKVGNPTVDGTIVSDFSASDYLSIPTFLPDDKNWEISLRITTGETLAGSIFNFGKSVGYGVNCYIDNNKLKVDLSYDGNTVAETLTSTIDLEVSTLYNIKVIFDEENYNLYINDSLEATVASTTSIWNEDTGVAYLGIGFDGSIDLASSYIEIEGERTWTGSCTSRSVLTYDSVPAIGSKFYDIEKYEFSELTFANYFGTPILDRDIFTVEPNTKYTVKCSYDGYFYKVDCAICDGEFREVLLYENNERINDIAKIVIGSQFNTELSSYLSPYSGVLNLRDLDINFYYYNDFGFIKEQTHYKFIRTVTYTTGTTLKDYYHIPDYVYSYFKVNNLGTGNSNSVIEIYEGYMKGREDRIDLAFERGFTLCVKAFLKDLSDKIILAKGDIATEDYYFILKEENEAVVFEYYLGDSVFTLKKEITREEISSFVNNPISLYITCDGSASPTIKMYRNNDLIVSRQAPQQTSLNPTDYYLTNQMSPEIDTDADRIAQEVLGFNGVLEESDLYYINNLLDTNF